MLSFYFNEEEDTRFLDFLLFPVSVDGSFLCVNLGFSFLLGFEIV
jgi:hypothetical protein